MATYITSEKVKGKVDFSGTEHVKRLFRAEKMNEKVSVPVFDNVSKHLRG